MTTAANTSQELTLQNPSDMELRISSGQKVFCCAAGKTSARPSAPSDLVGEDDPITKIGQGRLAALLGVLPDWVFCVRADGEVVEVNLSGELRWLGEPCRWVGRNLAEVCPISFGASLLDGVAKTLSVGQVQIFSAQFAQPGDVRDFEVRMAVCGPGEVLVVLRDVTERKRLEREIVEISHIEQQRIGQDLHDGLGQHLTGNTFLSKALQKRLEAKALPEATEAAEILNLVVQALEQTRSLARGLFPVELESSGLAPALKDLAGGVEKMFNVVCQLECEDTLLFLDRNLATQLFRIAQEAINNSVKHGQAKKIFIRFYSADGQYVLAITDDGIGLHPDAIRKKGLGLQTMQYRARRIGAALDIRPNLNGGTAVICTFQNTPLPPV